MTWFARWKRGTDAKALVSAYRDLPAEHREESTFTTFEEGTYKVYVLTVPRVEARLMSKIKYPVRARIVDVDGERLGSLAIATPEISRPHVGKEGTAALDSDGDVVILLDDGTVLYGWQCWWDSLL